MGLFVTFGNVQFENVRKLIYKIHDNMKSLAKYRETSFIRQPPGPGFLCRISMVPDNQTNQL